MLDKRIKIVRENVVSELVGNGISKNEAAIETEILIEYVSGLKKKDFLTNPDYELAQEQIQKLDLLIRQRIQERIPVQYLTNTAYFMGHEFYVDENVLIPRPETEILVEEVAKLVKNRPLKIIDIGTGSGCIACMLAKFIQNVKIIASDISEKALEVAKSNAKKLELEDKIEFIQSDIFSNIEENFDIIVSNPPYIPRKEKEKLQFEVLKYEPHLALFANDEKGISFYEKLISQAYLKLNPDGYLAVEIGISQSQYIKELLEKTGFKNIQIIKDYSNIDRIIVAQI